MPGSKKPMPFMKHELFVLPATFIPMQYILSYYDTRCALYRMEVF